MTAGRVFSEQLGKSSLLNFPLIKHQPRTLMQRQILRQVSRIQANAFAGQPLPRHFSTQTREFVPSVKGKAFNTVKLSDVAESGTADIDAAAAAARAAFDGPWSTMSAQDRGKLVYRLAELNIDDLAALEALGSTVANDQLHHV